MKSDVRIVAFEGIDGCGKTALLAAVSARLRADHRVLCTRLAPLMVELFKELIDEPLGVPGAYEDVLPRDLRHLTYIVESLVQCRQMREVYARHDYVLFDRWLPTNHVYLHPVTWHREWVERLEREIPRPLAIFYVRVTPRVALERLNARRDWMCGRWTDDELLPRLTEWTARYDRLAAEQGFCCLDGTLPLDALTERVLTHLSRITAEPSVDVAGTADRRLTRPPAVP